MKRYVCSLENAKRLAELGVRRGSYFWWVADIYDGFFIGRKHDWPAVEKYPAFSVGELGDMLPDTIKTSRHVEYSLLIKKTKDGFTACYYRKQGYVEGWLIEIEGATMVNVLEILAVSLLKNGHVKAEYLNG